MSKPRLELVSLRKEYEDGSVIAVDGIDLSIEAGQTVALLGPSGCGKSTTLNMIVGLEAPTSGDIQVDGKSIVNVPVGRRNVGLVFQDYAVFTTMSVRRNLAFGLEIRHTPKAEIRRAVEEVAELLGMSDKLEARAKDLGGSELQRVAIGRTLITKPSILLLDEPLSNLDATARRAMRKELRRLQAEIGITIVYVTHDQIEALSLADSVAVMRAGKILQFEKSSLICDQPEHVFVAGFLGEPPMNLIRGQLKARGDRMTFSCGSFSIQVPPALLPEGLYTLGIRPESMRCVSSDGAALVGTVQVVEARGPEVVLTLDAASVPLKIVTRATGYPAEGVTVGIDFQPESLVFFEGGSNRRVNVRSVGELC